MESRLASPAHRLRSSNRHFPWVGIPLVCCLCCLEAFREAGIPSNGVETGSSSPWPLGEHMWSHCPVRLTGGIWLTCAFGFLRLASRTALQEFCWWREITCVGWVGRGREDGSQRFDIFWAHQGRPCTPPPPLGLWATCFHVKFLTLAVECGVDVLAHESIYASFHIHRESRLHRY